MRRFLGILGVVVFLLLLAPGAVFAGDPPDTGAPPPDPTTTSINVDVSVTGDNPSVFVTANGDNPTVGITTSGDNAQVNVNGAPVASVNQLSFVYQSIDSSITVLRTNLDNLVAAYNASTPLTQKQIDDLQQTMNLLSTATAKLITVQGAMGQAIDNNEGTTQQSLADLSQSLVSLQKSLDTIYAEADILKAKIDTNQTDVTSEQAKFATAFNTFTSDTKANYGILVNAVNNLNEQASEQKARTDTVMKIAIVASAVAVISLAFAIIIFVKGLSARR